MMVKSGGAAMASERPRRTEWSFWGTLFWGVAIFIVECALQMVAIVALTLRQDSDLLSRSQPHIVEALLATGASGPGLSVAIAAELVVACGLVAGAIRLKRGTTIRAYVGIEPVSLRTLRNWLGLLVATLIVFELLGMLFGRSGIPRFINDAYATMHPVWPLWLAIVILGPLSEELLFRGFLLKGFAASFMGPIAAVVLTSGLWAGIHTQYDPYDMANIFCDGLLLGAARLMTGSLLVPLLLHALVNLLVMVEVALLL
jgi:membrane protease YdiL (CAAX protease family)